MRAIIFCFVGLIFIGCQSRPESADANEDILNEEPIVEPEQLSRPDPNAPSGEEGTVPSDWVVLLDQPSDEVIVGADPDASDIFFVTMTPGWHVTSGPAAIYYHPASIAQGSYYVKLDVHLFDPGQRNEAFGFFVGGENLEATDLAYDYFLIRNSGEFLIKRRRGDQTELIQNWTSHNAINRYKTESESPVLNELLLEVVGDSIGFMINGEEVVSMPASQIKTNGIVGFRVNHALNLHVSNLEVINQEG